MEGKGPYRIYDPGGSDCQVKDEASSLSYRQLLEENTLLRERMKGLKSLGDLLEESQSEAAKLRKRVEELVRDNEALKSSATSFASSLCMGAPVHTDTQGHGKHHGHPSAERQESRDCLAGNTLHTEPTESSSEFEVVNMEGKTAPETQSTGVMHLPQENLELASQLRRLESSFSVFAEESNPNQLLAHLGRMAVEFHHLSSKVQKNEQRTSLLQMLCEQLRQENSELRKKMEDDLQYRNRDLEQLRQENLKLKEQVNGGAQVAPSEQPNPKEEQMKEERPKTKVEMTMNQQSGKAAEKTPSKTLDPEVYEKKIKILEKQRKDVLEVNKQWDIQWNSMKTQFEQKITDLRQRLADSQKAVLELEAEREQRQRDYDKKLLLAKSKIDNVQGEKECLTSETCELKQKVRYLQDQLLPLTKQREYQEKEIQRLNRALEEALNLHSPSSTQPGMNLGEGVANLRQQELHTQIAVLKEQVKIFEEDFRKERSDRERMNEEKEDLRRQVERLQGQMTNLTNQLHQAQNECQRERAERCKLERLQMQHKQERRTSDPTSGPANGPMSPPYCGPFVQVGHQGLEGWPIHFPPRMPNISTAPGRDFQPINPGFPWQSSFPQPRGSRGQADTARPPPETAEMGATGFGKRERQNIDPGKH
ncbi:TNFAIP3-interacting protein 1 A20-binding inhibitor of NF-kappa-B activation 1 [Triplophysa tibetana]|uniref:TNFAIP3-interacting protein 1 n=1 Tax=Triplophysa tibetana TaxID=1572043 RepID=A0A5A9NIS1_9TELE|nr:TNFAIP3-interacting protein 1 A20-binding inhibitor of NF-kappa-B activation 1 [Triplophysa tibetana]